MEWTITDRKGQMDESSQRFNYYLFFIRMAETFRSDGKAVDVTYSRTDKVGVKGDPVYADGFHGILMQNASLNDKVAIEIAQREHEIQLPEGVTGAIGAIIYITSGGVLTNTASGNRPFCKVTVAKDSNDVIWGILLPQAVNL